MPFQHTLSLTLFRLLSQAKRIQVAMLTPTADARNLGHYLHPTLGAVAGITLARVLLQFVVIRMLFTLVGKALSPELPPVPVAVTIEQLLVVVVLVVVLVELLVAVRKMPVLRAVHYEEVRRLLHYCKTKV